MESKGSCRVGFSFGQYMIRIVLEWLSLEGMVGCQDSTLLKEKDVQNMHHSPFPPKNYSQDFSSASFSFSLRSSTCLLASISSVRAFLMSLHSKGLTEAENSKSFWEFSRNIFRSCWLSESWKVSMKTASRVMECWKWEWNLQVTRGNLGLILRLTYKHTIVNFIT